MSAKNALYIKEFNRLQVLRLLRQTPISRAELARQTGLTRAAISLIIDELMANGLVKESSESAQSHVRGRAPVLLKLCADGAYAIGIWLDRKGCQVGLCDFRGGLLAHNTLPMRTNPQSLAKRLANTVEKLLSETGIPRQRLLGVGIASPGPVDSASGAILNPPDFAEFRDFPIGSVMSQLLNLPVYLEKDANAAALHNYMDADFEGRENFLLLSVGTGVGSGVIWQGKLLRNCELGHTSIDRNGPQCACGNTGCLEVFAGIENILRRFPTYDSWDALMASVDAQAALELESDYLSAAIVNMANLLPLESVLLSGPMQNQFHKLLPLLQQKLQGRILSMGDKTPHILPAIQTESFHVQEACSIVFGHYLRICSRV